MIFLGILSIQCKPVNAIDLLAIVDLFQC